MPALGKRSEGIPTAEAPAPGPTLVDAAEQPLPPPNVLRSCALPRHEAFGQGERGSEIAANMLLVLREPLERFRDALPCQVFPDRHRALPLAAAAMQVRELEQACDAER